MFDPSAHPHRRKNLLTGEWLLVSPHRAQRPWQGEEHASEAQDSSSYEPSCYLCPGNLRANGERNPDYPTTHIFPNDFPALLCDTPDPSSEPLFPAAPARGEAHVLCYSPDHSATMARLGFGGVRPIVEAWCEISARLEDRHGYVQVFENKGAMMGCSSPHPHGQIWAGEHMPTELLKEDAQQAAWLAEHGTALLDAVVEREVADGARVVESNRHWVAIVPWWAAWPFETLVIARDSVGRLAALSPEARDSLAKMLSRLTARYDNLFGTSCPYSMGWHQTPSASAQAEAWRLHAHFYPPLLRSATIRKFMVGYEMLAEPQRDLTPEQAAERLRAAPPEPR